MLHAAIINKFDIERNSGAAILCDTEVCIGDESERQKIREALLEYCNLDTLAMVTIWQELSQIAEEN